MADLIAGVIQQLLADADLAALVADRVYVDHAPGGGAEADEVTPTTPYVVVGLISEPRYTASGFPTGVAVSRVQVAGYDQRSDRADEVRRKAVAALIGSTGQLTLPNGVRVTRSVVEDRRSGYDAGVRLRSFQADLVIENNGD